jgi:hypothetical protein
MRREEWRKACQCKGQSTTGAIRMVASQPDHHKIVTVVTLYPQPSCDVCGKPWHQKRPARKAVR